LIEERVETELDAELLHFLVDLGALDLRGTRVVHDLHARPLFHVVDDAVAHDAVGERLVDLFNPQVVEEVGGPQPLEVVAQLLLSLFVIRRPEVLGRSAEGRLDVIEIGLGLDDRFVDRVEPELGLADHRT
jgi:hypothetical protein